MGKQFHFLSNLVHGKAVMRLLSFYFNSSQRIQRGFQVLQHDIYYIFHILTGKISEMEPEVMESDIDKQIKNDQETYFPRERKVKKKLKVITKKCRGELKLMKMLIKDNNWSQVYKDGDLLWSGFTVSTEEIELGTEMMVNKMPAVHQICEKKNLGTILNKFREYWPEQFWFYPETFLLPEDEEKLKGRMSKGIFIAKPSAGAEGDGITLIKKLSQIPRFGVNEWIVQPYINNPLLLQGRKFDFRLYVLISCVEPYLCYLNEEGIVRMCSELYEKAGKENLKNVYMHLTNYSINKKHTAYVNGEDAFSRGGKRCLRVVWEDLAAQEICVREVKERIVELAQRFLVGVYPFLKYYFNATFTKERGRNFHVLGLDIMLDDKLNPWLLEVNSNPSFNIDHETVVGSETKKEVSPVDLYVKKMVMEDSIYLANRSLDKQKQMEIGDHYYSYKKILDSSSEDIKGMNIIENMLKLFHSQCGIKNKWVLTSSQFGKLARLDGMTGEKLQKSDYHLVFIKIMREKENPNQMEFEHFIEAMEYIVREVVGYTKENKLHIMQEHMDFLVHQI